MKVNGKSRLSRVPIGAIILILIAIALYAFAAWMPYARPFHTSGKHAGQPPQVVVLSYFRDFLTFIML